LKTFELKIEMPATLAEPTSDALLELGNSAWSLLEDIIAKRAWIVGFFPSVAEAETRWIELLPLLPVSPIGKRELRELADADWRDSYKLHFHSWQFGRLHWVPVWERKSYELPSGHAVLWLDPGLAFGTGNHETTRLCVERLLAFAERSGTSGRVVDAVSGARAIEGQRRADQLLVEQNSQDRKSVV
jgi:ribosomal protein L11 methyltransferase